MAKQIPFQTKTPNSGLSIFSVMTDLANHHRAVNLSQGFPDYEIDPKLISLVNEGMKKGFNQYAPMPGLLSLREKICEKYRSFYNANVNPDTEVTVTSGATQAIFTTIASIINAGDEVIIFEPAYDCYSPTIRIFGGIPVPIRLTAPDFSIDWNAVKSKISEKTKLIIINNPGNPSCTVWNKRDFDQLEILIADTDAFILADEVYEHLVYDGRQPRSILANPNLAARSFVVASFGKLLHATGWKLGYVIAPQKLTFEFRKTHQFNVFSANTPMQWAISQYIETPQTYHELTHFFNDKRQSILDELKNSRFDVIPNMGTYFILLNYANISDETESDFAIRLTKEFGIAMIPISAFYSQPTEQKTLRLCFAKTDQTLGRAVEILCKI